MALTPKGYIALFLHAHLPFIKHPEYQEALEEHWFFEAITECYIPLLKVFEKLVDEKVPFRLTMSLSPTLLEMFADPFLQNRYLRHLEKLIELARKEVARTKDDLRFRDTANLYLKRFKECYDYFLVKSGGNLIVSFKQLMDEGVLDVVTCGATHGFFPLMTVEHDLSVGAQVAVAVGNYKKHFNRLPQGIWLPECGYFPGDDALLKSYGLQFFFVDTHGLLHADPRPRYGVFAPCFTPSGVAVFGRDLASSKQVWSSKEGYPGDHDYREFYRDVGWDLDYDYIRPYLHESGIRKEVGVKYYRVTGETQHKEPYSFEKAKVKAELHAENFMFNLQKQAEYLYGLFQGKAPIIVSPYDAELFGHWWFEGPLFLDFFFRKLHQEQGALMPVTPREYLALYPTGQQVQPGLSSWGYKGYCDVWLNSANDWIYRHLHAATAKMTAAAKKHSTPSQPQRRALNQMARELLLAQSSDWAFIMKTGTVVDYAVRRTKEHLQNFLTLEKEVEENRINLDNLIRLEARNSLFPELDYRVYSDCFQPKPALLKSERTTPTVKSGI